MQMSSKVLIRTMVITATAGLALTAFITDGGNKTGIDKASMDTSVAPSKDFYTYANGTWVKKNPVPASEVRWASFDVLREENNKKIKTVVEEVAAEKTAAQGSVHQKLRDFYNSAMDSALIEKQGYSALQPGFDKIAGISDKKSLVSTLSYLHRHGVESLFNFYVFRDLKKSDENIIYFTQGGLGLPDRDYYLK
jgi:putative endopeptidase